MNKLKLLMGIATSCTLVFTPLSQAESVTDGIYLSVGDADGNNKCELTLRGIDEPHKYGDDAFQMESCGDGVCEWSAIGMSKNFAITAGLINSGGATALVKLSFPFGSAGKRIELTAFDLDGTARNSNSFSKIDNLVASA
jgi:hypothetical protein